MVSSLVKWSGGLKFHRAELESVAGNSGLLRRFLGVVVNNDGGHKVPGKVIRYFEIRDLCSGGRGLIVPNAHIEFVLAGLELYGHFAKVRPSDAFLTSAAPRIGRWGNRRCSRRDRKP